MTIERGTMPDRSQSAKFHEIARATPGKQTGGSFSRASRSLHWGPLEWNRRVAGTTALAAGRQGSQENQKEQPHSDILSQCRTNQKFYPCQDNEGGASDIGPERLWIFSTACSESGPTGSHCQ